jgi:hypothetical protein
MTAFEQMKIHRHELQSVHAPLRGFTGDAIHPVGSITLPLTVGESPRQATIMVNFLVVDCPSAYNVILGRTTLNNLHAVTSTRYLKMKFPTSNGIGIAKGDQLAARRCYHISTKDEAKVKQALLVEEVDIRDEKYLQQAEPGDPILEVPLVPTNQIVKSESEASPVQKSGSQFFRSFAKMMMSSPGRTTTCLALLPI